MSEEKKEKQQNDNLKSWAEVLRYAEDKNRKLKKTKLYADISKGRLRKQADGSFLQRDVDKYLASLSVLSAEETTVYKAEDRQRRKEEADIRKAEAQAKREEFNLGVLQGRYVPKSDVHAELAGRAIALRDGLKTAVETEAIELIKLAEGNTGRTAALTERLTAIIDDAMSEYARAMEFEVSASSEADASEENEQVASSN